MNDKATAKTASGEVALSQFWPLYLIDMFASQRTIVVGKSYDGAGTCTSIVSGASGVVVTFDRGKALEPRRMLLTPGGWGYLS
jgi:hypothetical protein